MKNKSKFLMDKEDYIVNSLSLGYAATELAKLTGKPLDYWIQKISAQGNYNCDQLTEEQKEQTIQDYLNKHKNSQSLISKRIRIED